MELKFENPQEVKDIEYKTEWRKNLDKVLVLKEIFKQDQFCNPKAEDSDIKSDDLYWEDFELYGKHLNFLKDALLNIKTMDQYIELCNKEKCELDKLEKNVLTTYSAEDKVGISRINFYARLKNDLLNLKFELNNKFKKAA
jgi:hypothetical protein